MAHQELLPHGTWMALINGLPPERLKSATGLDGSPPFGQERLGSGAGNEKGGQMCDVAWQKFLSILRPGVAEYEIVAEVEAGLAEQGAEDDFMLIASGGSDVRGMTPPIGPASVLPG